jgi:TolB protein
VLVGPYVLAHDPDDIQEARVWNVRIDKPVANDWHPNRLVKLPPTQGMILGSRTEILNVSDGKRKVIYESKVRLGSPSWLADGNKILFNEAGSLFTIPNAGGAAEKLNTGALGKINPGQAISYDGKKIAISVDDGTTASSIYTVPIIGGNPELASKKGSAFGVSWSRTNREIYYVASMEKTPAHIYKSNPDGSGEIQLTANKRGQVGGPEPSPDGKFIYYNDNISGTMQLWRMKPDGSGKERLTFDENHNWFPHISPDGKWIAYLSFLPDINPNALPSYKNVTLRLMPTTGGGQRVIAYLSGGQGTLNSACWSLDSKSIVFVSNSQ